MKDNAQVVRDSIEYVWNRGEYDRIPEFYSEDFTIARSGLSIWPWPTAPGRKGVKQQVMAIRELFPDYREEPLTVLSEGDMVAVRQALTGTHAGGTRVPPTGKLLRIRDMMFCRVRDGKLVEQWGMNDQYYVLVELGLVEAVVLTRNS